MRVELEIEDKQKVILDIIFRKTKRFERRHCKRKELIDTACIIFREDREIACAIARQNPLDNYNKIIGKKIALTKAIANLDFLKPVPGCNGITLRRRSQRQHIWNVFHQTFGRWN